MSKKEMNEMANEVKEAMNEEAAKDSGIRGKAKEEEKVEVAHLGPLGLTLPSKHAGRANKIKNGISIGVGVLSGIFLYKTGFTKGVKSQLPLLTRKDAEIARLTELSKDDSSTEATTVEVEEEPAMPFDELQQYVDENVG